MDAGAGRGAATVEAVVVTASGGETRYRRGGRGRAALLLDAPPDLFSRLTGSLRVVEPLRVPDDPGSPAWRQWLQELVDGLGLDRPAVIVGVALAGAVRALAADDPDRFGPVLDGTPAALARAGLLPDEREH